MLELPQGKVWIVAEGFDLVPRRRNSLTTEVLGLASFLELPPGKVWVVAEGFDLVPRRRN